MVWKVSFGLLLIVALPIVVFALLSIFSRRPTNLGVVDGRLAACPSTPNCVSTQAGDEQHKITPIPSGETPAQALAHIRAVMEAMPGATVVTDGDNYLHAEFCSKLFRFVDDVEFTVDEAAGQIHFRSASRAGSSDFGVNRARMEQIRQKYVQ